MKKIIYLILTIVLILPMPSNKVIAWDDAKAIFDDVSKMTSEEIVAEMKYAVSTGNEKKYYPKDRLHQLEQQIAINQTAEIERFKTQLKNDAEVAKQIQALKDKALAEVKGKGDAWLKENEASIQKKVEEQARTTLGISPKDWDAKKEEFNTMYTKGADHYKKNYEGYVDKAKFVLDLYQTYQSGKAKNPEAPDAAQNLVGFLDATGKLLNAAGEKMDKTPLRPIGEILKMYGAATGLGDTAAKAAWEYAHRDGISGIYKTQYSEGLEKAGMSGFDLGGMVKSNITMFDKNIRILMMADNKYAVFNDKFELIPGATGPTLTKAEYDKLEQIFTAFQNGKEDGWPNLNAEQLARLARGEKVKVTVKDNRFFSDDIREFDSTQILALGEKHADSRIRDDVLTSIDRIINGELNFFTGLIDPFTRLGRRTEINKLLTEYFSINEYENGLIHNREAFLEWVTNLKEATKKGDTYLTPEELKKKIKEELQKMRDKKEGKTEEDTEDDTEKPKDEETNPLIEALTVIDPELTGVDATGVTKGDEAEATGEAHWTEETPEDFNGVKDGGFTNTGGTNRPMPGGSNPQSIGIPVLKPNIYLYPEENQLVDVTFKIPQRLTTVIPNYENYWRVEAETTGLLDGQYGFLFYEAVVPEIFFQTYEGWILSVDHREESFERILNLYGFNRQEQYDFIQFWQERLNTTTEYLVYPQETVTIDRIMPIDVEPSPDKAYRIWFYFIPNNGSPIHEPIAVEVIEREGFSLVEWGGMYK